MSLCLPSAGWLLCLPQLHCNLLKQYSDPFIDWHINCDSHYFDMMLPLYRSEQAWLTCWLPGSGLLQLSVTDSPGSRPCCRCKNRKNTRAEDEKKVGSRHSANKGSDINVYVDAAHQGREGWETQTAALRPAG